MQAENIKFTLEQQMVFFARLVGHFDVADEINPIKVDNFDWALSEKVLYSGIFGICILCHKLTGQVFVVPSDKSNQFVGFNKSFWICYKFGWSWGSHINTQYLYLDI